MGNRTNQLLNMRELGLGPRSWEGQIVKKRCSQLKQAKGRVFSSQQIAGIIWLDLEASEHRYLLSGAADATLAIYDAQATGEWDSDTRTSVIKPVCTIPRNHPGAHQYMVTSVSWYPHDSGMFISGGHDQQVKMWDTNALEVVSSWQLPAKVASISMSRVPGVSHSLVAAACQDPLLRLCDPRTGAFSHTLVGHRQPIWSLSWSLRSEHELVSGDAHGQVCVWDIRRFGPLHYLDQYLTHRTAATSAVTSHTLSGGQDDALSVPLASCITPPPHRVGQGRAGSAPADLAAVMDSAWDTMDAQLGQARATASSSTGKRPRQPSAIDIARTGCIDAHAAMTSRAAAGRGDQGGQVKRAASTSTTEAAGTSSRGACRRGGTNGFSPYTRLPLAASAPHKPGRTGSVIGGRAPPGSCITGLGGSGAGGGAMADTEVKAHQGAVTCVLPSPDGLTWITGGTDSRLRLWDAVLWHRKMSGFANTHNRAIRARQLAVTQDGGVVFHPCGSSLQVFDVQTSWMLADLEGGHTESINAVAWNPLKMELYTGANDSKIAIWEVKEPAQEEEQQEVQAYGAGTATAGLPSRHRDASGGSSSAASRGAGSRAAGQSSTGGGKQAGARRK